jgi:hypothetical protein
MTPAASVETIMVLGLGQVGYFAEHRDRGCVVGGGCFVFLIVRNWSISVLEPGT